MKNKLTRCILASISIFILSIIIVAVEVKKINYGLDLKGGFEVLYLVESLSGEDVTNDELTATYKSISKRIDTLGVSEPEISIEGDKIRVKLPGVTDEEEARKRLSTPAVLTFRDTEDNELMNSSVLDSPGASLDYDTKTSKPVVALSIKDKDTFYKVTKHVSESTEQMITIWLDYEEGDSYTTANCGSSSTKCISAAKVEQAFSSNVIIQGNFSEEEASELVDLINSGSLPTKITEISTKTVDSTFGTDALKIIGIAGIITFAFISILMIYFYHVSGLISAVSLFLYIALVFFLFNKIDGVLTLTGIAALILGIGMAVDGAIITLEKIKEEVSNNKTLKKAYKEGNKRSIVSLIDANITTFLAALVLFIFGESNVKGFATMLILTIIVTMITMVVVNRYLLSDLINSEKFEGKEPLLLGKIKKSTIKDYNKFNKFYKIFIGIVLLLGITFFIIKGFNFGVDFTGGSALTIKSDNVIDSEYIEETLKDYTIIENTKVNDNENYVKIKETLDQDNINKVKSSLLEMEYNTDISVISNVVKKDLTKNAVKSLLLASIAILIYIAIRFNKNFGVSSIIAIVSDVIVTISLFLIFGIEVNFIFIAGILTIIGYSINDTIVVFDMIRDKLKRRKKITEDTLKEVLDESISLTVKRNILTSITTLSAIIILLIMNISGVKEFNYTVLFGLTAGSFSSLFIAPYIWLKLEIHELKNPKIEDDDDNEPEEKMIKGINI